MATNFLTFFHPIGGVRASATGKRSCRQKSSLSSPPSTASNWWAPLFGWSSDPDYIDSNSGEIAEDSPVKAKMAPGGFTEEKARRLRMMTTDTEAFHDVMYHSAIASRLASDFSRRSHL